MGLGWAESVGLGSQLSSSFCAKARTEDFPWPGSLSVTVALTPEASSRFFGTGSTYNTCNDTVHQITFQAQYIISRIPESTASSA